MRDFGGGAGKALRVSGALLELKHVDLAVEILAKETERLGRKLDEREVVLAAEANDELALPLAQVLPRLTND
ncbi:MAG: hypothetical protein IT378_11155 [Sandaracinaceae bacterium]|nr:hypothetical protein [Sandaracinaceae bacterium]